ncbi:hypothetical protein [Cyclobacterium marinum]|uniref:hypothetical protein n=1 Tax=Cyclobacterium marinum TaxID=104 RepID=UPI0030DC4C7B|tara:strand:- start:42267 stop:42434 length:168 start_codon:yes stop_codon:yes gene_type:complete
MDDKEYLKRLKEVDYIAWDSVENDPMIKGIDTGSGCSTAVIVTVTLIGGIIYLIN